MILAFSLQEKLVNQENLISQEKSAKTIMQYKHINKNQKQWLIR